jgi:hypothetical protein
MGMFKESNGKKTSIMRVKAFMLVVSGIAWGTTEIIFNFIKPEYDVHETLIIGVITVGIAGKGYQKAVELFKTKN